MMTDGFSMFFNRIAQQVAEVKGRKGAEEKKRQIRSGVSALLHARGRMEVKAGVAGPTIMNVISGRLHLNRQLPNENATLTKSKLLLDIKRQGAEIELL